jgi:PBP1b-binding outer membrane lipoprotein LpoB
MRKIIAAFLLAITIILTGCTSEADTANENLSRAAENFEVPRRITAINGITDNVLFTVEGFCSYEVPDNGTFEAICKNPDGTVERTTLYLSDNVTFISTQIGGVEVDLFRPRVIFRPETIIPNFDLSTSGG